MIFRQYELGCLSLFSYLVGDETTGRAVVVDPQRDVSQYLADAQALGLTIERVIENLVINALEAMQDGGNLMIATRLDGENAIISVADTGPRNDA